MSAQTSLLPFAYFRKEIVPLSEATVSIACHSLQYGTSCFGGIRGYLRGDSIRILRLKDHFLRLQNATKILGMQAELSWEDFEATIAQLILKNAPHRDLYIRPQVFSEDQGLKPRFEGLNFDLAIYMMLLDSYFDSSRGLRLMISSWTKVSNASFSTKAKVGGSYVNSALASSEAKRCGYDEALMMDDQGNIMEASVANLFIVYRGEVITPDIGGDLLEGITARTVLEILKQEKIPVRFGKIDRSMAYTCDELFLTGTAAQVIYGHSVDGRMIGHDDKPGPVCKLLRQKFDDIIEKRHPKPNDWITEYKAR